MPRTDFLLLGSAMAVLLLTGAGTSAADDGRKEVSFRDFGSDGSTALVGHLGLPIGQIVRLEGRRAPSLKTTNAATLEVVKVNGQDPKVRQPGDRMHIQVHNVESLPEDETIVVEGFEFATWVGAPTNWFLRVEFQVSKVVSPSAIVLTERGPRPTATRSLEIATPSLAWTILVELSGSAHAQYGSLAGDGAFVPPGTIDLPALARALSAAAGGPAPARPNGFQVTASWLCPADEGALRCDGRSDALAPANDAQDRIVRRLLEQLEPQWKADEHGTRRFEELRRTHPILPRN